MSRILYVGNKLEVHGKAPTSADILPKLLNLENIPTRACSSKKNELLRLLDLTWHILYYGPGAKFVLIDTYSTLNFWYAIWSGWLCRLLGIRYIPILRGGNLASRLRKNPNASKLFFNNSHINIAPSKFLLELFDNHGIINLKYIPNNIVLSNYQYLNRNQVNFKLLWVRAFDEVYNPLLAVTVLEEIIKYYPNAELCMVGPEKDGSQKKIKKIVKERKLPIKLTGKLSKEEWTSLSRDYDIFINTTTIDNTPVSVIEAMALGLPVVSTNVGGIPYLIQNGETGILVESNNPDSMARAVESLIKDPELANNLSRNGRERVKSFDWKQVKHFWLELLS